MPQPAERVLEVGREQLLEAELGHELVRAQPSALVDRAQKAVSVTEAGRRDGAHRPKTLMERARPGDPGRARHDISPRACRPPPWRPRARSRRPPRSPPSAPARARPSWPRPSAWPSTRRASSVSAAAGFAARRRARAFAAAAAASASRPPGFARSAAAGFAAAGFAAAAARLRRRRRPASLGRRGLRLRRGRGLRRGRRASASARPRLRRRRLRGRGLRLRAAGSGFGFAAAGLPPGFGAAGSGFALRLGRRGFFAARRHRGLGRRRGRGVGGRRRLGLGFGSRRGLGLRLRALAAGFFGAAPVGTAPSVGVAAAALAVVAGSGPAFARAPRPEGLTFAARPSACACGGRRLGRSRSARLGRADARRATGWPRPPRRRAAGGRRARRRPCGRGRWRCRSASSVRKASGISLP